MKSAGEGDNERGDQFSEYLHVIFVGNDDYDGTYTYHDDSVGRGAGVACRERGHAMALQPS